MYALKLPPEVVARLYRLREQHRLGSIRKQALIALDHYLQDMEAEYGVPADSAAGNPALPLPSGTAGNAAHPQPSRFSPGEP
jgi:hypothetical protein